MSKNLKKTLLFIFVAVLIFSLDRYTKFFIWDLLRSRDVYVMEVTSFFNLVEVWNYGVSFGLLSEYQIDKYLFSCTTAVLIIVLFVFFLRGESFVLQGLVVGGALGNLYDRMNFGAVFDFLDFHWGSWHYPAFNFADISIVISLVYLLFEEKIKKFHKMN